MRLSVKFPAAFLYLDSRSYEKSPLSMPEEAPSSEDLLGQESLPEKGNGGRAPYRLLPNMRTFAIQMTYSYLYVMFLKLGRSSFLIRINDLAAEVGCRYQNHDDPFSLAPGTSRT